MEEVNEFNQKMLAVTGNDGNNNYSNEFENRDFIIFLKIKDKIYPLANGRGRLHHVVVSWNNYKGGKLEIFL